MVPEIKFALLVFGILAIFVSAAFSLYALSHYRSKAAPRGWPLWRPRNWRPVWKMRDWFTENRGFRLYFASTVLLELGLLALLAAFIVGF